MNELRIKLRQFMNERDMTLQEVGILIDRKPTAVWRFLKGRTNPHERTIYKINKLLGETGNGGEKK